jgi:RNA polymerase sigma factor (sigma-70 family)
MSRTRLGFAELRISDEVILSGFLEMRQFKDSNAMSDDAELLQRFVTTNDESAFAVIVEQYKGLVYGSALRQTNNTGLAEEITQAVFIVLARKAFRLKSGTILSGWLFRTTRFIACDALKAEHRRLKREQASVAMNPEPNESATSQDQDLWREIAPVLDEALAHLGEKDRNALLLRFFEQKNLADVGRSLGIGEDGARKRVERALDKLRGLLGQGGVAVPAVVLGGVLVANAVPSVPASFAVGTTLTGTAATAPLVKGALAFMAWSKTKIALTALVTLLALNTGILVTVLLIQHHGFARTSNSSEFTPLFNGADFTGWKYNPQVWSVVDGAIVGRVAPELGMQNHCLIWDGEVDDFELHLKIRTLGNANSGVAFRAPEVRFGNLPGYQAELEGPRAGLFIIAGPGRERRLSRAGWRTAAREENGQDILDEMEQLSDGAQVAQVRRALEAGEWCDVSVIAHGPHVVITLNGVTITDTRDEHPTKFASRGLFGLEYTHNPGREDSVEFKDIQFKRLTPTNP